MNKIKNIRERIVSLVLASIMTFSMSSCSNNKKDNTNTIGTIDTEYTISTDEIVTQPTKIIQDKMTEAELNEYISYVNTIVTVYEHDEYYPTSDIIDAIIEIANTITECDYQCNDDIIALKNKLLENSADYVNENRNYEFPFIVENNNDELLLSCQINFEVALTNILRDLMTSATNNVNEDMCTLRDYKIVFSYDENEYNGCLAYTDTIENKMIIFPNRISEYANVKNRDFAILLEETIRHEINHVRQDTCKCRIEKGQTYLDICNPTLIEASAESELTYSDNTSLEVYQQVYYNERISEALLLTLGLFHDNMTTDNYYNAIFDSSFQHFYAFFNIDTKEDLTTLYNIFYAIDATNLRNDLFLNFYDVGDSLTLGEIKKFVGHDYKVDIFKMIIKNMMEYTFLHDDFKLKDNLVMFNIIKSLIVEDAYELVKTSNENNHYEYIYEDDFVKNVYDLENKYIEFLSKYYNVSIQDIRDIEGNYTFWAVMSISDICREDYSEYTYREYDYANELITRFPLLKSILNLYIFSANSYNEEFIERTGKTLTRTKSN